MYFLKFYFLKFAESILIFNAVCCMHKYRKCALLYCCCRLRALVHVQIAKKVKISSTFAAEQSLSRRWMRAERVREDRRARQPR